MEWIEIRWKANQLDVVVSPPSRWSGLKSPQIALDLPSAVSPPSRWSGLKFICIYLALCQLHVSTLAVEWIEILELKR